MIRSKQQIFQELQKFLQESQHVHVEFHRNLNPALWINHKLKPEVHGKLMKIAQDFREFLGIKNLEVSDITLSGSNAAYNYTDDSDIDLHLVVDLEKLSPYARELFDAKKFQYNIQHDIKIRGYDVELYVQDSAQKHFSQGIYSLRHQDWIKVPSNDPVDIDEVSAQAKYEKIRELINLAIRHQDLTLAKKIQKSLSKYRKAGLARSGEFGPENLAFKALRSDGYIEQLFNFVNRMESQELSLENRGTTTVLTPVNEGAVPDNRVITKIRELISVPMRPSDIKSQMTAYFVVPDPSMLHDFRKIQAFEGNRADLRQTFITYLATQMHPDVLSKVGIRSVNPPAPPIEVQPQAEIRENITAGAFAAAPPSVLGGMQRRPGIIKKKRKKTKENHMRLSEIQSKTQINEDRAYKARWVGPDIEGFVYDGHTATKERRTITAGDEGHVMIYFRSVHTRSGTSPGQPVYGTFQREDSDGKRVMVAIPHKKKEVGWTDSLVDMKNFEYLERPW